MAHHFNKASAHLITILIFIVVFFSLVITGLIFEQYFHQREITSRLFIPWLLVALSAALLSAVIIYFLSQRLLNATIRQEHEVDLDKQDFSQLASLMDSTPAHIVIKNSKGRYLEANKTLKEFIGVTRNEDFVGKSDHDFFEKEIAEQFIASDRQVILENKPFEFEETVLHDGATKNHLTLKSPIRDINGNAIGICIVSSNIDLQKQAEKELNQDLELLQKAVEASSEAVVIFNKNWEIERVNRACCEITGITTNELVGNKPFVLASNEEHRNFVQNVIEKTERDGQWRGEIMQTKSTGESYPTHLTTNTIYDSNNKISHFVGVFSDISERKEAERKLSYLAHYDALTELPNRALFKKIVERAINDTYRSDKLAALLFIDLDNFKDINDIHGHSVGDQVLHGISKRIRNYIRKTDSGCHFRNHDNGIENFSRLGGDEFAILATHLVDGNAATTVTKRIMNILVQPLIINSQQLEITASIGIALAPVDTDDYEQLMQFADMAMYSAKQSGRNQWALYNNEMSEISQQRMNVIKDLQHALDNEHLELYYQPKYSMKSKKVVGMEALIRWNHPDKGLISPDSFITIAEESGLIIPIGNWVIETACKQAKLWHEQGYSFNVSVNVSPKQLQEKDFSDNLYQVLNESGFPAQFFEIEITENFMIDRIDITAPILKDLRSHNIRISIDDFGTGYSSLSYLENLPITTIKIDRSFVNKIVETGESAIVVAVLAMAHHFDLEVVAEGVETEEQLNYLKEHNCDIIQGYYFGKPVPVYEFEELYFESQLNDSQPA